MRVLFTSLRNIGHFQPLVPLIEACLSAGHDVVIATPPDLRERALATGAHFLPLGHPGDEGLRPLWDEVRAAPPGDRNHFVLGRIFAGACASAALPAALAHTQSFRPDVIVRDAYEYSGLVAGLRLAVPTVRVAISLEQSLADSLPIIQSALAEHCGALPLEVSRAIQREPILTQFPPDLWPESPEVRLFRFRLSPSQAPEPLLADPAWEDATLPLVYLTLGTVAGSMDELCSTYRLLLDAVAPLPVRALLTTGESLDPASLGRLPERVVATRFVPQASVLRHARGVVCHGGSGTVLGALGAGVPLVVLPMFADQPENARRVEAIGAGLSLDFGRATPESLGHAVMRVLTEPGFSDRARAQASAIGALPDVRHAPAWLARLAEEQRSGSSGP